MTEYFSKMLNCATLIKYEHKRANDAPMIDSHYGQRLTLLRIVQRVVLLVIAIMSWNDDMAYAMTLYKFLTLPLGVWPLQKYNTFSLIRSIVCGFSLVCSHFFYYIFLYQCDLYFRYIKFDSSNEMFE